jgi:hypothetical protein
VPCCCRGRDAAALQDGIDEVNRALLRHGLPFGAKAAEPQPLTAYPFSHDAGVSRGCRYEAGMRVSLLRAMHMLCCLVGVFCR